jgi:hypothetical protein
MDGSNITETTQADQIINYLKDEANTVLSAVLGSTSLQAFNITSQGNMPYIWQDPANLTFNAKTYEWIEGSMRANTMPHQFDPGTNFTNRYLNLASKIGWSLSSADQAKLNKAYQNASQQQAALLNVWQAQIGELPAGKQPINGITEIITATWANPPTTLEALKNSINPNQLLNKVPASGEPVIPVLMNWINAIEESIPLQNQVTMNNAYLGLAINAIQYPTNASNLAERITKNPSAQVNGGLTLNNGNVEPAYSVANPVNEIENALANANSKIEMAMSVKRTSSEEFDVSISGGTSFSIPVLDFLSVGIGGSANYFSSDIATSSNETYVKMTYPGVNLINFGPAIFQQAGSVENWFWMSPLEEALKNGYPAKDVSGFKFATQPPITDFSGNGPFGYLAGAAVAGYPTVEITVKSADYQKIEKTLEQTVKTKVSFLGIPLGGGSESTYSHSVKTDSSSSTVTITLTPPDQTVAGKLTDASAWVLGVQPVFPASNG